MKPKLIFCMGSNAEYAQMSLEAGWDYGFRSTEKPKRNDVTMIDVDWRKPNIVQHLVSIEEYHPWVAVCPDVLAHDAWTERMELAYQMHELGAENVMIVPKVTPWKIPNEEWIILGYPIGVGEGSVCPFTAREAGLPMHLLGGTITGQLRAMMHFPAGLVISGDMSAHTKAARFGDWYHPGGRRIQSAVMPEGMTGRQRMLRDVRNSFYGIKKCWDTQAIEVASQFVSRLLRSSTKHVEDPLRNLMLNL